MTREEQLEKALRDELIILWSDFDEALRHAIVRQLDRHNERTGWSIQMLNLADRITDITKLVGSPDWKSIPVGLLLEGWWAVVHERVGLPVPPWDRERAQEVWDKNHEGLPA